MNSFRTTPYSRRFWRSVLLSAACSVFIILALLTIVPLLFPVTPGQPASYNFPRNVDKALIGLAILAIVSLYLVFRFRGRPLSIRNFIALATDWVLLFTTGIMTAALIYMIIFFRWLA